MKTLSILGFIAETAIIKKELDSIQHAIIVKACQMVATAARELIGHEHPFWPALAPETIADRVRAGYAANEPLLRTGELRDSIKWNASGNEGWVGSDNDKAVWHELGTSHVPPRPFLTEAAKAMEGRIQHMAARAVVAVIGGRGLHGSEFSELVHLLKHAVHEVKEEAERYLEGEDQHR